MGSKTSPENAVERASRIGEHLVLELEPGQGRLRVEIDGACLLDVERGRLGAQPLRLGAVPLISFGALPRAAGYGARVELVARAGCAEAKRGALRYRQVGGSTAALTDVGDRGFRAVVRLPSVEQARAKKWSTSRGMSSLRWRRAGNLIGITLSR